MQASLHAIATLGNGGEVFQKWFKANERHLDPNAPLIREDFDKKDSFAAKHPKRLSDEQISELIRNAAIAAGIRKVNKGEPFKRHKVMITHGFRKLFKRKCRQAHVDLIILERLMGHKSGNLKDGITKMMMIYDPEEWAEMQSEFEKAIPTLTINKDALMQAKLEEAKEQLTSMAEKNNEANYILQEKLVEKERQFDDMKIKVDAIMKALETSHLLIDHNEDYTELLLNSDKMRRIAKEIQMEKKEEEERLEQEEEGLGLTDAETLQLDKEIDAELQFTILRDVKKKAKEKSANDWCRVCPLHPDRRSYLSSCVYLKAP